MLFPFFHLLNQKYKPPYSLENSKLEKRSTIDGIDNYA